MTVGIQTEHLSVVSSAVVGFPPGRQTASGGQPERRAFWWRPEGRDSLLV